LFSLFTSFGIRGSSVSITIRLGGLVSESDTDFRVWNRVRVGSASSSLILWVSGDLSGLKWLDAMFSSSSQVKYAWNCTYIFPYVFTTYMMKPRDSCAFLSIHCPYFIIDIIFEFLQGRIDAVCAFYQIEFCTLFAVCVYRGTRTYHCNSTNVERGVTSRGTSFGSKFLA